MLPRCEFNTGLPGHEQSFTLQRRHEAQRHLFVLQALTAEVHDLAERRVGQSLEIKQRPCRNIALKGNHMSRMRIEEKASAAPFIVHAHPERIAAQIAGDVGVRQPLPLRIHK